MDWIDITVSVFALLAMPYLIRESLRTPRALRSHPTHATGSQPTEGA